MTVFKAGNRERSELAKLQGQNKRVERKHQSNKKHMAGVSIE
jgi:hypothetical protein